MQEEKEKIMIEIIMKKIIHPQSKKGYSKETVTQALKDINYNVRFDKDPKQ